MHACVVHEIDDVEALVQSTSICTRRMHDNLHKHACMSVMYLPNLVGIYIDIVIYES